MSGSIVPAQRTIPICHLILSVPLFVVFGALELLTPEAMLLWTFLLSLVTSNVMMKMPTIFVDAVGGSDKLIKDIRNYAGDPLKLYGNPPLCCIAPCAPPKRPVERDIRTLRIGIYQFCFIQPILTFIELFLSLEQLHHVAFVADFAGRERWLRGTKVLSNLVAMSACTGLAKLCESADPNDNVEDGHLVAKRIYVQGFLWGLNLIPALTHGLLQHFSSHVTLSNGSQMAPADQARCTTAAVVCLASAYVTRAAFKAFPVDDRSLYPNDELNQPFL